MMSAERTAAEGDPIRTCVDALFQRDGEPRPESEPDGSVQF